MRSGKRPGVRALKVGDKRSLSPPSSDSEDSNYGPDKVGVSKTVKSIPKRRQKKSKVLNDEALYFLTKFQPEDRIIKLDDNGVNLWLILREVEQSPNNYQDKLPAEILIKIIKHSIKISNNPLLQLVSCSQVSEYWRQIVIFTSDLWWRFDLTNLPQTPRNIDTLKKLFILNPNIAHNIRRLDLEGWSIDGSLFAFMNSIIEHQKLEHLGLKSVSTKSKTVFFDTISKCFKSLKSLVINHSASLWHQNQNWIVQQITNNERKFETLDLNTSLRFISPNLAKAICSPCCSNLKVLDLSTGVNINQGSAGLDATLISNNLPNLEVFRCVTTSFRRVVNPPRVYGLPKLKELSIPTLVTDHDRDDALFGTLAYGSMDLEYLDLRGSTISTHALNNLPSFNITALHIDEMASNPARNYRIIIKRWAKNLECLSLLRVNNEDAVDECMEIIAQEQNEKPNLRAIDLSGSDVSLIGLKQILSISNNLEAINLSSCRCLPRGFKGTYSSNIKSNRLSISTLRSKVMAARSD